MSQHRNLRIINVCPLLPGYEKELADDLRKLQLECGITDVAFMIPLVPEEEITSQNKAERFRELLEAILPYLKDSTLNIGILLQSTLGHGTFSAAPFRRSVNAKGTTTASMCPLDKGLLEYLYQAIRIVCSTKPRFLLLDDDFRLSNYGAPGCFCDDHLAALEQRCRRRFTREELLRDLPGNPELDGVWESVKHDSLINAAKVIRDAIDSVDASIPCGYCLCDAGGNELQYGEDIEKTVAGKQAPFVRIGNAWYWNNDSAGLTNRIYATSAQMKFMSGMSEILAESDTYPHNRHFTSARAISSQIYYSLLHGCTGLKLWVTKLNKFQPAAGQAYRDMLKENIGAFRELRRIVPDISWTGPVTPLPAKPELVPSSQSVVRYDNWTSRLMARLGIPARVGHSPDSRVTMLTGPECELFTDDELRGFAARSLMLDGGAALAFCKRGLGGLLGVNAEQPSGWRCSFELTGEHKLNGEATGRTFSIAALAAGSAVKLSPDDSAIVLSELYSIPFNGSADKTPAGAGLTLFENPEGGKVAVFAALLGPTPFLDDERRSQLVNIIEWLDERPIPVTVLSDTDVYALCGTESISGDTILAMFNLSLDTLDHIRLKTGGFSRISKLEPSGMWMPLEWHREKEETIINARVESASPLIIRLTQENN